MLIFVDNKESFLDHAQHLVKGRQVSVESLRRGPRRLRMLRVPMCVPNGFISSLLAKHHVKVTRIDYERNLEDGLTSNVRIATVEASHSDLVPDTALVIRRSQRNCVDFPPGSITTVSSQQGTRA